MNVIAIMLNAAKTKRVSVALTSVVVSLILDAYWKIFPLGVFPFKYSIEYDIPLLSGHLISLLGSCTVF